MFLCVPFIRRSLHFLHKSFLFLFPLLFKLYLYFKRRMFDLNWESNLEHLAFQASMQTITPSRFKYQNRFKSLLYVNVNWKHGKVKKGRKKQHLPDLCLQTCMEHRESKNWSFQLTVWLSSAVEVAWGQKNIRPFFFRKPGGFQWSMLP